MIYRETAETVDEEQRKQTAKWANRSHDRPKLEAMDWAARSELPVSPDELDRHPMLLNLENGTLDLETCTLREHRRGDLLTKCAPVALAPEAKCPLWLAFLDRTMEADTEVIGFLQRAVGYSLTGLTDEQVFFLCHGEGANGKSTFLDTLQSLMGDYARPTEFRTLLHRERDDGVRNDLAALFGTRLVTAVEIGRGRWLDEAVVKQLTGGDKITARFLHKEFFDFYPSFKLWLAANQKPEIRGQDEAIWRRVLLVPFDVYLPPKERDKRLPRKLHEELPGILKWAVEGLRAWQERGLDPPERVTTATESYREEMDLLRDFLAERCVTAEELGLKSRSVFLPAGQLRGEYEKWCEEEGEKPVFSRTFGQMLAERGFPSGKETIHGKQQRVRYGLQLREIDDRQAEMEVPF
jgi:putative DNA primase/helicase